MTPLNFQATRPTFFDPYYKPTTLSKAEMEAGKKISTANSSWIEQLPTTNSSWIEQLAQETIKATDNLPETSNVAIRHDQNKTQWDLLPMEAIEPIVKVLEFGAAKYSANNWRVGEGFKFSRVLNSMRRHLYAYIKGQDNDPESGLPHLAHIGCNVMFLLYYSLNKSKFKNDDRFIS